MQARQGLKVDLELHGTEEIWGCFIGENRVWTLLMSHSCLFLHQHVTKDSGNDCPGFTPLLWKGGKQREPEEWKETGS